MRFGSGGPGKAAEFWARRGTIVLGGLTMASLGVLVVAFLWFPIVVICIYAFNATNIQSWPISGWSLRWFCDAWHDPELRDSLLLSVKVAFLASGIALMSCSPLFQLPVRRSPSGRSGSPRPIPCR